MGMEPNISLFVFGILIKYCYHPLLPEFFLPGGWVQGSPPHLEKFSPSRRLPPTKQQFPSCNPKETAFIAAVIPPAPFFF